MEQKDRIVSGHLRDLKYAFTPAAERALRTAGRWRSVQPLEERGLPELLIGLLGETECRAAQLLLGQGIDELAVRQRWPDLYLLESDDFTPGSLFVESGAVRDVFARVKARMWDYPPLEMATEHLLWGLLDTPSQVSAWLQQYGLSAEHLEQEILARLNFTPSSGEEPIMLWGELAIEIPENDAPTDADTTLASTTKQMTRIPLPELITGDLADESSVEFPAPPQSAADPSERARALDAPRSFDSAPYLDAGLPLDAAPSLDASETLTQSTSSPPLELSSTGGGGSAAAHEGPVVSENIGVWRVIDASGNRAREALRVVEDYARFVLDDRFLTEHLKSLRHELVTCLESLPRRHRIAGRETQVDVGAELSVSAQRDRRSTADLVAANFSRLVEALRSLEEFTKLVDLAAAAQFERLRYRAYTLERAVDITAQNIARLQRAQLYVLIDGSDSEGAFIRKVRGLVEAGVDVLQLRDKRLADRDLLGRARFLRELTAGTNTLFIMNDRPDLAAIAKADGVHIGQDEVTVKDARSIIGASGLIGVSTHAIEQARQAVLDGADYLGVGPVFVSPTKKFARFPGLDYVRAFHHEIRLPAFAIGGITLENVHEVIQAGARRIALASAITGDPSPAEAARAFRTILRQWPST